MEEHEAITKTLETSMGLRACITTKQHTTLSHLTFYQLGPGHVCFLLVTPLLDSLVGAVFTAQALGVWDVLAI
jgi:hypothetical protein